MTYLLDTWTWVEYFAGTEVGHRWREAIEGGGPATCVITLAELSDRDHRDARPGTEERGRFVQRVSVVLPLSPEVAIQAGATKRAQRARGKCIGIADALIYQTAQAHGLVLLTGDPGFEGLLGVEPISPKGRKTASS